MRIRIQFRLVAVILALTAAGLAASAIQVGLTDAAERAGWEEFLRTARIVDSKQMGGPEAVTNPWKLTLSKGDVTRFGLWKNIDLDLEQGGPDRWRFEIAAYRLDVLLGLGMVPPTVERAFQGQWGSLQLWIEDTESLKNRLARGGDVPRDQNEAWNRKAYLERAFDSLIANDDRNVNNILIGADTRMILIDHSRTFRTAEPFDKTLVFGASGLQRTKDGTAYLFVPLTRAFVDKIRALDAKSVKDAVKGRLTGREIQVLLARRDLVLKEIEGLIRERGEAAVLY
ncbi:MAG: hypothetical protein NTZ26_15685, partial [Candidatus Aminicenantes bacterium]|nr:hypothetical protein [Candidatus Aminicenantes bacterium]